MKLNNSFKTTIFFFILFNFSFFSNAQNNGPISPEASSFEPLDATDLVNLATGDLSYVLPLLNVPSPEGGYPIVLSYHAGIAMEQESTWIGLGWNINPGSINRSVNGYPDDWKNATSSEFYYDRGESHEYYNFSIGGTLPNGITLGMSAAWGDYRAWGGIVGYGGVTAQFGSEGVGLGVGLEGTNLNLSLYTGKSGTSVGIGYSKGGSSLGISYNLSSNTLNGSLKYWGTGIDFSSRSSSIGISIAGMSKINSVTRSTKNDYHIIEINKQTNINLGFFWYSYGHLKYEYSLFKKTDLNSSGILNAYASKEVNSNFESSELASMDSKTVNTFLRDNYYENSNYKGYPHLIFPNYDNYFVSAQGLSGSISPSIFEEIELFSNSTKIEYEIEPGESYKWENIYLVSDNSSNMDHYKLNDRIYFYFDNTNSSFFRKSTLEIDGPSDIIDYFGHLKLENEIVSNGESFLYETLSDPTYNSLYTPEGYLKRQEYKKRDGSLVTAYTNAEILSGVPTYPFIEASGFDRTYKVDLNGIGAYQITSNDGKIYHYSLPVYAYEEFYRSTKNINEVEDRFYESKKTAKYATHWLLTAITGPDYIDINNNHRVDVGDFGYWIEFEYGKWSDGYSWRSPKTGYKELGENHNFFWGRKQIYYLDAIHSRTHSALFVKDLKKDGLSSPMEIYTNKYYPSGGDFDIDDHVVSYEDRETIQINEDFLYTSEGNQVNINSIPSIFRRGKKMDSRYVDIPLNYSLRLSKIILLNREDAEYDKSFGELTPTSSAFIHYNDGYSNVPSYGKLYKHTNQIDEFNINISDNILDVYDIIGQNLEDKSLEIINLEQDYSLAHNTPNSNDFHKGRLTLKKINFIGKSNVQYIPPYLFEYFNAQTHYDSMESDDWGYYKNSPQTWSLEKIISPLGDEISIAYEEDSFFCEAANRSSYYEIHLPKKTITSYTKNHNQLIIDYDLSRSPLSIYFQENFNSIKPGVELTVKLSGSEYVYSEYVVSSINASSIEMTLKDSHLNNSFHSQLQNGTYNTPSQGNIYIDGYERKNIDGYDQPNGRLGGGIRVKSVEVSDGDVKYATYYDYFDPILERTSGITVYAPYDNFKTIPFISEIPGPTVSYEYVTVTKEDSDSNSYYKSIFNFETIKPSHLNWDEPYYYNLGNSFYVKKIQKVGDAFHNPYIENAQEDVLGKYEISNKLSILGRLNYMRVNNSEGHQSLLNQYFYKDDLNNDGQNGVSQETFLSRRLIKLDSPFEPPNGDYDKYYIESSSYIKYPNTLLENSSLSEYFKEKTSYLQYDFLTGQILETQTTLSDGTQLKNTVVPAYMIPQFAGNVGGYGMGPKVDDITRRNMLLQVAVNYSFIKRGLEWKPIGVGITTWKRDWWYRNLGGIETTPIYPEQKIWRKYQTYVWDGEVDEDGIYVDYNVSDFDGFDWGLSSQVSPWKKVLQVERYDHYSMPLEISDINNNFASTKMGNSDSQVIATSNAMYTEMFYSGAEYYYNIGDEYFDGEVSGAHRSEELSHTGRYSVKISSGQEGFAVEMKGEGPRGIEHRPGKYLLSVWANIENYQNARIKLNSAIVQFNGEFTIAGNWVQMNHYFDIPNSINDIEIAVTSASGIIYFDDFRISPIASSMTSYVYNEFDELAFVLGSNNLGTKYQYDGAGRLIKVYEEIADTPTITGGFKLAKEYRYNYKDGEVNGGGGGDCDFEIEFFDGHTDHYEGPSFAYFYFPTTGSISFNCTVYKTDGQSGTLWADITVENSQGSILLSPRVTLQSGDTTISEDFTITNLPAGTYKISNDVHNPMHKYGTSTITLSSATPSFVCIGTNRAFSDENVSDDD